LQCDDFDPAPWIKLMANSLVIKEHMRAGQLTLIVSVALINFQLELELCTDQETIPLSNRSQSRTPLRGASDHNHWVVI